MRNSPYVLIVLALSGCTAITPTSTSLPAPDKSTRASAESPSTGTQSTLLYITGSGNSRLKSYDWATLSPVRNLRVWDLPAGLCVDAKGAIFVADTNRFEIVKFRHGGRKPTEKLPDPGFYPQTCAIDPTSGDLAVTNGRIWSGTGNVVIFRHARGEAKAYTIPTLTAYRSCAYDSSGNLMLDGSNGSQAAFAMLPHGKTKLESLTIDQQIPYANGIQWDGSHWAIGSRSTIYQVDVSGKSGTVVGTTTLYESDAIAQFSIYQGRIIAPEETSGQVQIFNYPAGGTAIATIQGFDIPVGTGVSPAH